MRRSNRTVMHGLTGICKALIFMVLYLFPLTGSVLADVPGRTRPGGSVPNPGTQQKELANITAPAEWNVFEFVVTCGACHAGTVDQHTAAFGNWAGGNMASAARDPIFRAAQISTNDTVKAITGQDGAGNVCFRCHSPNGWLSGRFDPVIGGKADGSALIQSILASTDSEGISCEACHRAVGNVTNKRADLSLLDSVWNLLAGLFDWQHIGKEPFDQVGTPTIAAGNPYGDTTLQYLEGMTYIGKYSGMTDVYFSDLPIGGSYTGQIYGVYPDGWIDAGNPVNPAPPGQPATNSAGQFLAYNLDGTLPPLFEVPVGTPTTAGGLSVFSSQAFSIEHPTVGGAGRSGARIPFVKDAATGATLSGLQPPLPAGPAGTASPNEFIRSSEFCGSCHDLTVPVLNHGMPEQRTYSEWKFSSYAQSSHVPADPLGKRTTAGPERCQDCHMPTLKHEYTDLDSGSYNADPWLVGGFPYGKNRTAQGGTSLHKLTGSNRDLPQIMKVLYPEVDLEILGIPTGKDPRVFPGMLSDRSPMWDRAKQNTEITLRDGVDVRITQAPVEVSVGVYEFKVKLLNKSGHRLPSGYPDGRRFWLSVQAKDSTNAVVYESGVYDAANAELKTTGVTPFKRSLANVIDATIPANNAVQVYERVTGMCYGDTGKTAWIYPEPASAVAAACTPSPSVLNNFILFDNRIPPKGFDAANARNAGIKFWNYDPLTFAPIEEQTRYSAAQQAEGSDEVTYRFSAPAGLALSASAEVYWQTLTREFVEHLRNADTSTVRPEGPPNPLNPNYPNVPNYLSDSINGRPLSSYSALDGSALNDNWGGVAYAAWLATGKGTPFLVDRDDTAMTSAPAAPALSVRALISSDPDFIDQVTLAPNIFAARIEWTPVADADGYMVWIRYGKSEATADWDRLVTTGKDVTSHTEHVLGDASVGSPGKTYGFKVVAFNGKGAAASAVVDYTVASSLPAAPSIVTTSNAAPGSTASRITLTWNDNASNEARFEVWRYGPMSVNGIPIIYNGLPPVTILGGIGTQTGAPAIAGQQTTGLNTYIDSSGLHSATCYNYQVRAVTANIDVSTWAVAANQGCTIIAAPTITLTATAASGTRIDLAWSSDATGVASYRLTRTLPVPQTPVTVAGTAFAYADTNAAPSTTYTYMVEAIDAANAILATASTNVTTPAVPLAPSNLVATANGIQVILTWLDNANNENGFVIERAPVVNGMVGAFQQVPAVGSFQGPNTKLFVDTVPLEAQTSVYRVKAIHLVRGDSGYTFSNYVTLGLFAPLNLAAAIDAGLPTPTNVHVTMNWIDVSQKETSYMVERKIGATGAWTVIAAALPADSRQLADLFPVNPAAFTVQYRVTAVAAALTSQVVTTSLAVPARPATGPRPTVNNATGTTLDVSFTLPAGSLGYQIQRRAGNGAWTNLGPTPGTGAISITDTPLANGTTYQYQVKVANPGGWSANWSNSGSGTTLAAPAAPARPIVANTGLCDLTNSGACTQTVNFTISTKASAGWEVQRCTGSTNGTGPCSANGSGWALLQTGTATGTQIITSGSLLDNTTYRYRVNQSNAIGASNWSGVTSTQRN